MTSLDVPFQCGNCGALVDLTIQVEGDLQETREVVVTCDCGKVQWMTLTPIMAEGSSEKVTGPNE